MDKNKVLASDRLQTIIHFDGVQIKQVKQFKHLWSLGQEKKVMCVEQNKLILQEQDASPLYTNPARTAVWIGHMEAAQVNKLMVFQMFKTNPGSLPL